MHVRCFRVLAIVLVLAGSCPLSRTGEMSPAASSDSSPMQPAWMADSMRKLTTELLATYGNNQLARLERGLKQVASFWRAEDGDATVFEEFVRGAYAGDQAAADTMFNRFESLFEQLDGHMHEINRAFTTQTDLDLGPVLPFDEIFAAYDPAAHINDDFFTNKLAFVVLLNFPLTTLDERLTDGEKWSRRQWAEVRLAQRFSKRIPADVYLAISQATSEADSYIASYNIWMHHLINAKGERLFPPKLRLLSHWNLRDEIKADYSDARTGLAKQRTIQQVMERIVTQTIPAVVVDNPNVDWNPLTNEVKATADRDSEAPAPRDGAITNAPEPDTRYAVLLKTFLAAKKVDPYSPTAPTLIARRFDEDREMPEARVKAILEAVLTSPLAPRVAQLIEKRLGRPLEPFDIWYNGFRARGTYSEEQLDALVSKRYPTAEAYKDDMPNVLMKLGFSKERSQYIADHIIVDPARGSGHAMGAMMRSEKSHLRTRVEKSGMNYKGFNIAVHEMGHNVEQTFSLCDVDHTLLMGVPNTAFTEALAMVLQGHDIELLGLSTPDTRTEALAALNEFWGTFEISGVALVDMAVWHWMYDHPKASPAELRAATIQLSKDIWNTYYAPLFKKRDVVLLGIYSHMIHSFLYLPDYPIGHTIGFQVQEQMKKAGSLGAEFERVTTYGRLAPDLWMKNATGAPVGPDALLAATERALQEVTTRPTR